jgi:hypothetical protein
MASRIIHPPASNAATFLIMHGTSPPGTTKLAFSRYGETCNYPFPEWVATVSAVLTGGFSHTRYPSGNRTLSIWRGPRAIANSKLQIQDGKEILNGE